MGNIIIEDVILTPLKKITHPQGDILHGLKNIDSGYVGFGEAYFSTVIKDETKSWKLHTKMTLNLIVPVGAIRFVLYDHRENSSSFMKFYDIILSPKNYFRLTVPPNIWLAFRGIDEGLNLLLNIADLQHDPLEVMRKELSEIPYHWDTL